MPAVRWRGGVAAASLALWPASAGAAEVSLPPWAAAVPAAVVAAGAVIAVIVMGRTLGRARAAAAAEAAMSARLEAVLSAAETAALCWTAEGETAASANLPVVLGVPKSAAPDYRHIRDALDDESAASLDTAVAGLHDEGRPFSLTLRSADGERTFRAVGKPTDDLGAGARVLCLTDVSEDARERASLARKATTLDRLLDALPAPVWWRDADGHIVHCNRAYVGAVEADSRAAVIDEGREITTGIIADACRNLACRARESGEACSARHHVVVNGARRLLEFTESPVGEDGTVGMALDLTEVYDAQSELTRHLSAHGEVLENLTTAIIIFGPDKRVKFFNGAYTRLWQLDEKWLHSEPGMAEVLDALRERRLLPETADFPAYKQAQLKLFTSLIEPHEELVHQPNGTTLRMRITPHPLGGLLFTYEDVTDKLALERSYNTLIEVQRETLNNLSEGVAVFGSDGRLKLSNPVYGRMWQLPEHLLRTEPHVSDVLEAAKDLFAYGADWPAFKETVISRVTGRVMRHGRIERTDGSVLKYGMTPLPDGAMLASYLDVTDSIRAEQALRERAEALETADRLKSEFIANVSYELRTPLNTIIGFTEILKKQYFGALNERQGEYAEGILDSSRRLLALINDILDLATIEAGRMLLDVDTVDIRRLLDGVINLTRDAAREQDLNLVFDCPDDIGAMEGDERRLKHALFNLVGNAIKFTAPGGTVTLSARREGDEVVLAVADDGIGISEEDRERVFEKFVRGKNPEGRAVGAGLGLPLVKSLIELHGGSLSLESQPQRGTRIICRFPVTGAGRRDETDEIPVEPTRAKA